jgi:hypothetical protein
MNQIGLIFYLIIETGTIVGMDQTIMENIEHSDASSSLLWGSMGITVITLAIYLLQWHNNEQEYVMPLFSTIYSLIGQKELNFESNTKSKDKLPANKYIETNVDITPCSNDNDKDDGENIARPLVSLPIAVESFLRGVATFFQL